MMARGKPRRDEPLQRATAPYNFVPFPDSVVWVDEPPPGDRYHANRYTGVIELVITAKTPLFIGGTRSLDADRDEKGENAAVSGGPRRSNGGAPIEFFAPRGSIAIPGSSLRGMLRSLVEIISSSATPFIEKKRFTFRAVASRVDESLARVYREKYQSNVKAGYLHQDWDGGFYLCEAIEKKRRRFWPVHIEKRLEELLGGQSGWPAVSFLRCPLLFEPPEWIEQEHKAQVRRVAKHGPVRDGLVPGWLVVPGPIEGRVHAWIIAEENPQAQLDVPENVVRAYRASWSQELETQHKKDFPLLPGLGESIPCFYLEERGKPGAAADSRVAWIGHTRNLRVPYQHHVCDALPDDVRAIVEHPPQERRWTLAEALFGTVSGEPRRGRVFVEDALLQGNKKTWLFEDPQLPQVLSSPKPTSFQLYLQQDSALATRQRADLQHWDSNGAKVRGVKVYWHRPGEDWTERSAGRKASGDSQGVPIRPIKEGAQFRGRIRFENLTAMDLGALLAALELPEGCAHRLGMGKPLGLGSAGIKVTCLRLDDRRSRYQQVCTQSRDGTWSWAEPDQKQAPSEAFLRDKFAAWLLEARGVSLKEDEDATARLWQLPELQVLRRMLSWAGGPPAERTAYAAGDPGEKDWFAGFRRRDVLPLPEEVMGARRPDGRASTERGGLPSAPAARTGESASLPAGSQTPARPGDAGRPQLPRAPAAQEPPAALAPPVGSTGQGLDTARLLQRFPAPPRARGPEGRKDRGAKGSDQARRRQEELMRKLRGEPPEPGS
ncbi:MAG: TIGR03986 family CRISPR-associated RAMP protein [Chloroflexi bacterium]|nr:TIGR03986 family CRISPR-associated RAMP protein [Chloroflexota bacterium]